MTDCVLGVIERETTSPTPPPPPPPPLAPVTVTVALAEAAPAMLAVMVALPAETAVANPDALTVTMLLELDVQLTRPVTSWVVDGC